MERVVAGADPVHPAPEVLEFAFAEADAAARSRATPPLSGAVAWLPTERHSARGLQAG